MILCLNQHIYHAQSLTAQSKWILGAGRNQTAAEGSHDIINLVSQGNDTASNTCRLSIASKPWHVVFVDSLSNSSSLTIKLCILATHDALQLGKLANHTSNQVSLSQLGSTHSVLLILSRHSQLISNIASQSLKTYSLVSNGAQALLEHNSLQLVAMSLQRLLSILIKEELSILKTGTQHALITMLNNIQEILAAISDGDEERHQLAILQHWEITLMITHRGNNSLSRQLQILVIDGTAESSRILYQIQNLL